MIKVIIFSDIRIYSEGLGKILSSLKSIQVVGTEAKLEGAINKISQANPDVVLLDMTMAGACCTGKKVMQCNPDIKIIALAAPEDEENIMQCAEAGFAGYIAREASLDELIDAVKATESGEIHYPPKIGTFIFNRIRRLAQRNESDSTVAFNGIQKSPVEAALTNREHQISNLVSEGLSNKQIARNLSIEVSTVKNHVHNILVKLHVKSRVQVVSLLQQSNLRTRSSDLDLRMEIPQ